MPLIQSINGTLLTALSQSAGTSKASGGSTVGGRGVSSSFDGDAVDLSGGLETGAAVFARSVQRINESLPKIVTTRDTVQSLTGLVEKMIDLADKATQESITIDDRIRLDNEFQHTIADFRQTVSDAASTDLEEDDTEDLLNKDDLQQILEEAGINTGAASRLAQAFSRIAGVDGRLAQKPIRSEDVIVETNDGTEFAPAPSGTDPLNQEITTIGKATIAKTTLQKFHEDLTNDLQGLEEIVTELTGAYRFAVSGYTAFLNAGSEASAAADADDVARIVVESIRRSSRDTALAAHSDLDTELAKELLGQ